MVVFLIWLAAFNGFALVLSKEDSDMPLREVLTKQGAKGVLKLLLDLTMLLGMLPFLIAELITVWTYGFRRWLTVYNTIDVGTYFVQLAIVLVHTFGRGEHSHALSIAVAVQSLMLWTKFTYFLRAYSFSSTVDTIVYVVRQCS